MTNSEIAPWYGPINALREYRGEIEAGLPHIGVSDRNEKMVRSFLDGATAADLARSEGLSDSRVGQLIKITVRQAMTWRTKRGDPPGASEGFGQATTLHAKLKHISLACLPLLTRGQRALEHAGFRTIGDIWLLSYRALCDMPNVGLKTADEILTLRAAAAGVANQCESLDEFHAIWRDLDAVKRFGPIHIPDMVPTDPKPMEILGHCPANIAHGDVVSHEGKFFCGCRCGWEGPTRMTRDKAILAWRTRG